MSLSIIERIRRSVARKLRIRKKGVKLENVWLEYIIWNKKDVGSNIQKAVVKK